MSRTSIFLVVACLLVHSQEADDLVIVAREEWGAQPPKGPINALQLPVGNVIISHTVTPMCTNSASCKAKVAQIQSNHMNMGFSDIGYNFLVGGDGVVYEGRGPGLEGAHTKGHNKGSLGIAFIGNFESDVPTPAQLKSAQLFLEKAVRVEVLSSNYKLYGQKQFRPTVSPGKNLYEVIKTWPHWSQQ